MFGSRLFRIIYKIHFTEIFNIKRIHVSRELFNLSLIIFLIISGSFYFAFQGVTKAQSTSADTTASTGSKNAWQNPVLIGSNHLAAPSGATGWFMFKEDKFKDSDETTKTTANLQIPGSGQNSDALNGFTLFNSSIVLAPGQGKVLLTGQTSIYTNPTSLGSQGERHTAIAVVGTDTTTNQSKVGDFVDSGTSDSLQILLNSSGTGIAYGRKARDDVGFGTSVYAVDTNLKIKTGSKQNTTNEDVPIAVYSPGNDSFYIVGVVVGQNPLRLSVQKVTSDGNTVSYDSENTLLDNVGGRFAFYSATVDKNNNLYVMHPGASATDLEIETLNLSDKVKGETYHFDVKKNQNSNGFKPMSMFADSSGNIYATAATDSGLILLKREDGKWSDANTAITPISTYGGDGSSMYGTSDGGTIFISNIEPEETHAAVYIYTSYDGGKTFSKEKVGVWKASISSTNIKVDQQTAIAHLLIHMESSVNCNQQDEGQSLCGIERRDFYTSAKVNIKQLAVTKLDVTCDTVTKVRYMPTDEELKATSLFSPITLPTPADPNATTYLSGKTTVSPNDPKVNLTVGGKFTFDNFIAPQNVEYPLIVSMAAYANCPPQVSTTNDIGYKTFLDDYAGKNNTTYDSLIKDAKGLNTALIEYHKLRYNSGHAADYLYNPNTVATNFLGTETTVRNLTVSTLTTDTLVTAAYRALANAGVATADAQKAIVDKSSTANLAGLSGKPTSDGDLILKHSGLTIDSNPNDALKANTTGIYKIDSGDLNISATTRSIIGQQNTAANNTSTVSSVDRIYAYGTTQAEIVPNSMPNVTSLVTSNATFALVPFRIESSDKLVLPIKQVEGFASLSAAQSYYDGLDAPQKKLHKPSDFVRTGPVINWLTQQFGSGAADDCALQMYSGSRCSQLDSAAKSLSMDNDDFSILFNNIGIPKSGVKYLKEKATDLSVGNLEADVNVFAKANSYKFDVKYDPDITISGCDPGLCESKVKPTTINAVAECDACSNITDGLKDLNGAAGGRVSVAITSDSTIPVVKDTFNYAKKTSVYNGKTISLDRTVNTYGFANYTSLYNSFPYVNIERSVDPLPFITSIGQLINKNGSDYKPFLNTDANVKYGNVVVGSPLFSSKAYGIMPLKDDRASGTKSDDTVIAYQAEGTNTTDTTVKAVDLTDVMKDKGKLTGYEYLATPFSLFDINTKTPQMAVSSVAGNVSCDLSENFHALVPTRDTLKLLGITSPSIYLSWTNQYVSSNNVTSESQCSNIVKNDFTNVQQWKIPALLPSNAKMVASSDPVVMKSTTDYPRIAFLSLNSSGINAYITRAETKTDFTYFYDFSKKDWVQVVTAFQLIDGNSKEGVNYTRMDLNKDFGMDTSDITKISYESTISPTGKLTVVVTSTDGKMGIYNWDLSALGTGGVTTPTKLPSAQGSAFKVNNFLNTNLKPADTNYAVTPDSVKVTSVDIDPNNERNSAFSLDFQFKYIGKDAQKQSNLDKHYPVIFYNNSTDISVFDYNPEKLAKLYEDNSIYLDDNKVQIAKMDVQDMKFIANGNLNVATEITSNAGEITDPHRSAAAMVIPCDNSDSPTKFSVYFDAATGVLDCTGNNNYKISKDDTFGYYLTIDDNTFDTYFGRQVGKATITQLYSDYKEGVQTAGNGSVVNAGGSDQRPSDDYAEELWGVSNSTLLVGDQYKSDATNTELKTKFVDFVVARSGRSRAAVTNDVNTICNAAANGTAYYGGTVAKKTPVACAILIAIWGAESSFGVTNGQMNCLIIGTQSELAPQAQCAADTMASKYYMFTDKGIRTQTGNYSKKTIKFDNAFDLTFSYYVPIDLRLHDPNGPYTWDQCNKGLVIRPDQAGNPGCNGDQQISGTTYPHAAATDTRITIRTFLYGNGPLISGGILPLSALDNADVPSFIDPRIILTRKIYNGSSTDTSGSTIASNAHVNTSADTFLISQGDKCEQARSLSKTTTIAGLPVIDFRATMANCLGTAAVNTDITGGSPTYIIMHDSVSPSQLDYVNLSESHKYSYNLINKQLVFQYPEGGTEVTKTFDPVSGLAAFNSLGTQRQNDFQWSEPTYHVYIRKDGSIQWGQDWTKQSVHANGSCGGVSCNTVAVGISLEGEFTDPPTSASMQSAIKLVKYLQSQYAGITTDHVLGHCEVQSGKNDTVYSDINPSVSKSDPNAYCIASSKIFRDQYLK